MGIVAFYVNKYEIGYQSCLKAIEYLKNNKRDYKLDQSNLEHYEKKINELKLNIPISTPTTNNNHNKIITKNEFILKTTEELRKQYPALSLKNLTKKANNLWKTRNIK